MYIDTYTHTCTHAYMHTYTHINRIMQSGNKKINPDDDVSTDFMPNTKKIKLTLSSAEAKAFYDIWLGKLEEALKAVSKTVTIQSITPGCGHTFHCDLARNGIALGKLTWDTKKKMCTDACISLERTFGDAMPSDIRLRLRDGDIQAFNGWWNTHSVKQTRVLLKTYGMPQVLPIDKNVLQHYVDPHTGWAHVLDPHTTETALRAWDHLPRDLLPDDSIVPEDGIKTQAGTTLTPLHYDGEHGDSSKNATRTQVVVLLGNNPKHLLCVIPDSDAVRHCLAVCTGTSDKRVRGFKTLNLQSHPRVTAVLKKYAVTAPTSSGVLFFKSGVLHFEDPNPNFDPFNKDHTFRIYASYRDEISTVLSQSKLLRLAFMRSHGYALAPFERKINGTCPIFVNDKSTQYYVVKHTVADPKLKHLFDTSHENMVAWITKHVSEPHQRMMGLKNATLQQC